MAEDDDDVQLNEDQLREIKMTFAQVAATRYRDHIAEVAARAIEHEHMSAHGAIAVLLSVAAIIAASKLGATDGAALVELMAHQCAEGMKRPRPATH